MSTDTTISIYDSVSQATSVEKHKFVFLGDASTGKTSIITRFMYDSFDPTYQSTIGIDFVSKTCHFGERSIRMQLWDTAGQERFRSLIPSYIRDSTVAILVYDVTNESSFQNIDKWYTNVKEQKEDVITILVGNKMDLENERVISTEEGEKKATELHSLHIETSAKNGTNIDTIFRKVLKEIPPELPKETDNSEKYIRITTDPINTNPKGKIDCVCFLLCSLHLIKMKSV